MENDLNFIYIYFFIQVHTKNFQFITAYGGEFLKHILANLYCTTCNEINIFFELYNSMFHIQVYKNISDILWAMPRNGWKYIVNCVTWFLTLSNKVEKCLIPFVCPSVRPSVCAHSNCCRYSSNVFKFIYAVLTLYRMDSIDNDMYRTKCSFTETHKSFPKSMI